jgi:hypothetical protein
MDIRIRIGLQTSRVRASWAKFKLGHEKSSRAELMTCSKLKNLAQTQFVTIRADSRANTCVLTRFDI